jgi:Phage integrase, N-terminal SAM-like domain
VNNSRKSRAKPKHYEERKTFYRSDTKQPKLLDQVRNRIRCKHYSIRTEQAYIEWIRKFIFYHGKRHPAKRWVKMKSWRQGCQESGRYAVFIERSYFETYAKTGTSIALYPFVSGETRYYAYDTRDMQSFWFKRTGMI